jgi:hypothetical protein
MAAQRLDPDLWAHILGFLHRPLPAIKVPSDLHYLHQADLVSALRVSKVSRRSAQASPVLPHSSHRQVFHDAASRHLYREALVDNLELFFQGTINAPAHLNQGRRTKLENIRLVHTLHLVYTSWSLVAQPLYSRLLSGRDWDHVKPGPAYAQLQVSLELQAHFKGCEIFKTLSESGRVFPLLEAVVVGGRGGGHWEMIEEGPLPSSGYRRDIRHQLFYAKRFAWELAKNSPPKSWCQHIPCGPFTLNETCSESLELGTTFIFHWHDYCRPPTLVWGSANRYCFAKRGRPYAPNDPNIDVDGMLAFSFGGRVHSETATRIQEQSWPKLRTDKHTTLELFGLALPRATSSLAPTITSVTSPALAETDGQEPITTEIGPTQAPTPTDDLAPATGRGSDDQDSFNPQNEMAESPAAKVDREHFESCMIEFWSQLRDRKSRSFWKTRVDFGRFADTPVCEGCGYEATLYEPEPGEPEL